MKRVKHPVLVCLAIVVVAAVVDTALAKWVWHGPGPWWFHDLFSVVSVVLPVMFIVWPFMSPPPLPKSDT